jgi:pimeloyl-ACP methyl ester carboxylesterase
MESIRVAGPQGTLNMLVRGDQGVPVLLVHGNGGRARQWEPQIIGLAGRHRVAALDLRGMGASEAPGNGDFSIGALADDGAAVADALGFDRFFLVGHSLGSHVAAACAGKYPERVHGLVLVDHGGDARNDSPEDLEALVQGLAPESFETFTRRATETCLKGARPEVRDQVLADLRGTPWAHFGSAVLALLDFDAPAALATFPGPKLHIHSGFLEDQQLAPIHVQAPGIEVALIQGCSHWVHLDRPDAFNARLGAFLARHSSRTMG